MKPRIAHIACLFAAVLPCEVVLSQPARVTGTLGWVEVIAGTNTPVAFPNGVLEPGEGARVQCSISFTPAVGMLAPYQLPGGGSAWAPVAGLSLALFSIEATNANGGTWSHLNAIPGFVGDLSGLNPNGSVVFAGVYQPWPPLGSFPLATNPLPHAWSAVWTPPTYEQRLVTFDARPGAHTAALFVHTGYDPAGNPLFAGSEPGQMYGDVQIPVVPVPPFVGAFLAFSIAAIHRRRQTSP